MRFIALLFAFYIFALSSLPCSDKVEDNLVENTQDHSHESEDDQCSVLCICTCCGTPIIINDIHFIPNKEHLSFSKRTKKFYYKKRFLQSHIDSIWHPPIFC